MMRWRALESIGGFPTDSVTEDFLITLRLQEQGWRTVYLNEPLTEGELRALRTSVERGRPFGTHDWAIRAAETMGLLHTLHEAGRPRRVM